MACALPLWLNLTAVAMLLALSALFFLNAQVGLSQLRYPAESAGRLTDRHWSFYEGYESTDEVDRALHRLLFGSRQQVVRENLALLREVMAYLDTHPAIATSWAQLNARARLLVGLGEAGLIDELDAEIRRLGFSPEEETIAAALRYAYALPGPLSGHGEIIAGLNFMPLGWAADRLALRIAERSGETSKAASIATDLARDGAQLRFWNAALGLVGFGLVAIGLIVLLRGGVRRLNGSAGPIWRASAGFEVLLWSALAAIGIGLIVQLFGDSYFRPGPATAWAALLAGLPLLWLTRRRLLRESGLNLRQAFGLRWRGRVGSILASALALFAAERCGALLIAWSGAQLGLHSHWSQGLYEPLIFGPERTVWLAAVAMLVWSPLIEEIAFRGVLFRTLVQHWRPLYAAIAAALGFAVLHAYSLTAFVAVFWSGLVLAWGYQRSGSLLPGMLAHALANAFALAILTQFYR